MFIAPGRTDELVSAVAGLERGKGDAVALFIGEKNRPDLDELIAGLTNAGVEFFGGIFPGVIDGTHRDEEGVVAIPVPLCGAPSLVHGLEGDVISLPDFGDALPGAEDGRLTAMVLVDGLTANIALFLQEMYSHLGPSVNYFGGGAGSLSLQQEPCVFTREGLFQDAAVVGFVPMTSHLGVRHGWEKIMGPLVATRTQKNVIVELNWRNAFEVYRETVEPDCGRSLAAENFFDIAKGYPFGMLKEGMEDIVRDPIAVNEAGELVCVGEVPENSTLSILRGRPDALVRAAGQAADDAVAEPGAHTSHTVVVDCISRAIFLEDGFSRELAAVADRARDAGAADPCGILSLGEISSYGEGYLEFFNKTIAVGAFQRTS